MQRIDLYDGCNALDRSKRQVPLAALEAAHVRAVDPYQVREGFL